MPKTTLNTIVKECEGEGYVALSAIPGSRRELQITLTERGMTYADDMLERVHQAEQDALLETLKTCSPQFIQDFEEFAGQLENAFAKL